MYVRLCSYCCSAGCFVVVADVVEVLLLLLLLIFNIFPFFSNSIFEAGYTMKKQQVFNNFSSILLFAVLGTFISTFVVSFSLFGLAEVLAPDLTIVISVY